MNLIVIFKDNYICVYVVNEKRKLNILPNIDNSIAML